MIYVGCRMCIQNISNLDVYNANAIFMSDQCKPYFDVVNRLSISRLNLKTEILRLNAYLAEILTLPCIY